MAGSDFWRTSLFAGIISLPVYILPYAFVFGTPLLMRGSPVAVAVTTATAAAGVILTAYALVGSLKDRLEAAERVVVFAAAVMLIAPGIFSDALRRGPGRGRPGPAPDAAQGPRLDRTPFREPGGAARAGCEGPAGADTRLAGDVAPAFRG